MSEKEFNQIFSNRLRYYLDINNMSQAELAAKLGVGTTSVSNWVNGLKTPRMGKVDAMCEIFGCRRSDLIIDREETENGYYTNPETASTAQEIYDSPGIKILFDAARDSSPEDLQTAADFLNARKKMQLGLNNEGA